MRPSRSRSRRRSPDTSRPTPTSVANTPATLPLARYGSCRGAMSFPLTPIHPRTAITTPTATSAQPATSRGEPRRRVRTRSMTFLSDGQGGDDPPREQGKSGGDGDDRGDDAVVAPSDRSGAAHVLGDQSPARWR